MRARLIGDALWADFVSYTNTRYKQAFVRVFEARELGFTRDPLNRWAGVQVHVLCRDAREALRKRNSKASMRQLLLVQLY